MFYSRLLLFKIDQAKRRERVSGGSLLVLTELKAYVPEFHKQRENKEPDNCRLQKTNWRTDFIGGCEGRTELTEWTQM